MTDETARETPPDNVAPVTEAAAPVAKKPWKKPVLTIYHSTAANHADSGAPDGGVAHSS